MTSEKDRMRKEFEDWLLSNTGFDTYRTNFAMTKPEDQQYQCHHTNLAWLSWKASRETLCIDLPRICNEEQDDFKNKLCDELDTLGVSYK